jgi:hypothetical protein
MCALLAVGCGSSSHARHATQAPAGATGSSSAAPGALSAEARSAATGDIPDNQVFLVFRNRSAGYSIKYPEGWTRSGSGSDATLRDKNNVVRIVTGSGRPPTLASVTAGLKALKRSSPDLTFTPPRAVRVGAAEAIKSTYSTRSAQDPVTGRSVVLVVDRYALSNAGRLAVVDLGTPRGVDNVDAYRMMIESFRWG